jgi:AGZA family xanthine/uracil permease-like MFS transporter
MQALDRFFKYTERGSSLGTEVRGGLTTFLAMAYIIAVNPLILADCGVPFAAGVTATCLGAAIMTIAMGIFANRPLACASGMGINAVVAYSLATLAGCDWHVAMAVILIEGVVILLLVLCGLREAIMDAIPLALRQAIGVGIGLFIAFIGLKNGEVIVADSSTFIAFGQVTNPAVIVALVSILVTVVLYMLKVKGEMLIGIIVAVIVGIPLGVTTLPTGIVGSLDFSTFGAPFMEAPDGQMALIKALTEPTLLLFAFSLLMSDFFDTMGTAMAVAEQGDFIDEQGNVEDIKPILIVDSAAAVAGGLMGCSSITTFVESTAGASAGARSGLASVTTGLLFLLAAFFSPLIAIVSSAATTGALVMVGFLMMSGVTGIDWADARGGFCAFITIIGIPFTYSIATGIGLGFVSYVIISVFTGRVKDVKPLMWVAAVAFFISFLL